MTNSPRIVRTTIALMAGELDPHHHVTHSDGRHCVSLSPAMALDTFYLEGSLDELAKFVLDLADVVRELNARELAKAAGTTAADTYCKVHGTYDCRQVTHFDGTRAPVQAVVDALEERFVNGQEGRW